MKISNTNLFLLTLKDNEVAFKQLYDRLWKSLYLFSLKLLKNETEAKDVVQDVFCNLWTKRKELEINNVQSYLFSATKYKCLEYIRKNKNYTDLLNQINLADVENNTERELDFRETKSKIEIGINSLPLKTKQVFTMSRYDDLSNKEIAHKLNISIKTVEYHITQSIKRLTPVIAS
ncbi:RNA polymerase sigma-70 factor [Zobellia laminariae]|uniref:RNA polymerase sigma-70 factor n=1 Tax=Zobellia laminariae TaxID=248906 RepID=UPI0026F41DD9|nr:RNA polymerase sigma-70 factor [Zobellia laminariae]WKX75620.1 RNA polymerase sigma-70 factor [Zobellia laminariae]